MSYRARPSVTVVKKMPFSVVYTKVFDDPASAYEHSQELPDDYDLKEYNIVLTLEGSFDIIKYLDIINKADTLYMN